MTELASKVKRGTRDLTRQAGEAPPDREENGDGGARQSASLHGELLDAVRQAAIEVLQPVMRKATTSAAKYAVTHGPGLIKDQLEQAGGAGALAKGVASKGGGLAGAVGGLASKVGSKKEGKSPSGTGRGRRLPVQEHIDVGVDLQTAYDQFTQFEDWPQFMHRVERIEQRDDATLMWHENIWGVRRSWEAEIEEQVPCERIVWRSKGGPQTIGVVTFHRLSENLTRIAITMDFQPKGLFEKTASGMRISRRALRSDLMRFKAFIELRDEATGEWRGRIEEGEPVDEERDDDERDERDDEELEEDEEPRAEEDEDEELLEEDEELEDEEEEEPRAEEDEDEELEEEEPEAVEEEKPRPRRRSRRKATASRGKAR